MPFPIPEASLSDLDFSVEAYTEQSRVLVYPLLSKTTEETEKMCERMAAERNYPTYRYSGEPHGIFKVVPRSSGPGGSFQDINACLDHYLQHHLGPVMQARRKNKETDANIDVHPRGFVVMTPYNVDAIREGLYEGIEDGMCEWPDDKRICTANDKRIPFTKDPGSRNDDAGDYDAMAYIVHFDKIRRRWYVGAMKTRMDQLVCILQNVTDEDATFRGQMSEDKENAIGNNDYMDAAKLLRIPGRNIPFSPWSFLTIVTWYSMHSYELFPFIDPDFFELRPREKTLHASDFHRMRIRTDEERRDAVEVFMYLYCSNLVRPRYPGTRPLHPKVFICSDDDDPDVNGVWVCYFEWDGVVEGRSYEDLEDLASEAKCTWWKCDVWTVLGRVINMTNRESSEF